MSDTGIKQKKKTSSKLTTPKNFNVIVLNDDHTPMDFVISMLMAVFGHNDLSAIKLTQKIHEEGAAVAGTYDHQIAEQKMSEGLELARLNSFPLRLKIEEV